MANQTITGVSASFSFTPGQALQDGSVLQSWLNQYLKGQFYPSTAIPAGGTAGSGLKLSSVANFGVFFGSGAPTLAAAKGSLYLRSDGSGVNDRAYINTDGGTTWTAVTTAA